MNYFKLQINEKSQPLCSFSKDLSDRNSTSENVIGLDCVFEKSEKIKLHNSTLENLDIQFKIFNDSDFSNINMTACDLFCCHLQNSDFTNVKLKNTKISFCNFSGANLYNVTLKGGDVSLSSFCRTNMQNVSFKKMNLRSCEFCSAILQNANFESADLSGSDFTGADLRNANLSNANLMFTNFENANLDGAILTGAKICETDITIKQIIGDNSLKHVIVLPYYPPKYRNINFSFPSNQIIKFRSINIKEYPAKKILLKSNSSIYFSTYLDGRVLEYYFSIETDNKEINALFDNLRVLEKSVHIKKIRRRKIIFESLDTDINGYSMPVYGFVVYFTKFDEVKKCMFYHEESNTFIQFTNVN